MPQPIIAAALLHLGFTDYSILVIYFGFVVSIGILLRRVVKTGEDFLTSGRSVPGWVAALAFLSANLGAQEMIGMAASGAKYGFMTTHFYWLGAVPAMVFVGVFMLPFYYGSKARSVPEYLKLRFDEKTRAFNAFSFADDDDLLLRRLDVRRWRDCWSSARLELSPEPCSLGAHRAGLHLSRRTDGGDLQRSAAVLPDRAGLPAAVAAGAQSRRRLAGLVAKLNGVAANNGISRRSVDIRCIATSDRHTTTRMGVEWFGLVMGLGFVLSFGYWCTDFLVIQRAMAAKTMGAARRTPLIAAVPKMLFPVHHHRARHGRDGADLLGNAVAGGPGRLSIAELNRWNPRLQHGHPHAARPLLPQRHARRSGLTALMASFMSGMAGNVTAFNTVWTYDIYESYIRPGQSDRHYLNMGRFATVFGIAASTAAAYVATKFNNIMDLLQLVFAFVNAPLFATFLLGMFWRRTTGHGAFLGLLSGTLAAAVHHGTTLPQGSVVGVKGGWLIGRAIHQYPSEMAQGFWTAIWAFGVCFGVTLRRLEPHPSDQVR